MPNSLNQLFEDCMVNNRENYWWDLGSEWVNRPSSKWRLETKTNDKNCTTRSVKKKTTTRKQKQTKEKNKHKENYSLWSYFKEICQNKLLPYPRNLNYNSNDMKKTNKNKTIPHGITLRRFVKINFYFIQEILIPIQTIRDMEGKCQKMSIQCSCHEFPGPYSLLLF